MISFIIPAYNAGKTIKRAIDSILNQTTKTELEIVIVNDSSTDNLKQVIEQYKNIKQIKYYEKQNEGVASARNFGVKKAQGDYIIFVDADDYISDSLLEDIKPYIENKCDLIKWKAQIVTPNTIDNNKNQIEEVVTVTTGEEGFNKLYGIEPLLDCLWNYAIKKDLIVEFPKGRYHEDFAVMPQIILKAKSMAIIEKIEYYYIQTDESIMRNNDKSKKRKKLEDILKNFDYLIEQVQKTNISTKTKENVAIFATNSLLVIVPELEKDDKKYFEKELKKRKISKNIKVRNAKQLIKRLYLNLKY